MPTGPAAVMGDKAVGICTHIVLVPAPPGPPVPTPLPHPYSGTILLGCATNVLIGGKPAAVLGSGLQNIPPHIPTPPGVGAGRAADQRRTDHARQRDGADRRQTGRAPRRPGHDVHQQHAARRWIHRRARARRRSSSAAEGRMAATPNGNDERQPANRLHRLGLGLPAAGQRARRHRPGPPRAGRPGSDPDHSVNTHRRAAHAAALRLWRARPDLCHQRSGHARADPLPRRPGADALGAPHRAARGRRARRVDDAEPVARPGRDRLPAPRHQRAPQPRLSRSI